MRKIENKKLYKYITYIGLVLTAVFFIYCFKEGLFTSKEKMNIFLTNSGIMAPLVFIFIQMVQVIFPIIPGSLGCPIGIVFWGPVKGFIYNYIGICAGSIIAFLLAKKHGRKFVRNIIGDEKYEKYDKWLDKKVNFKKIFTALMFFPFAPDDLLCYFAGLTKMKLKFFLLICFLSKPIGIITYSYVLVKSFQFIGFGG